MEKKSYESSGKTLLVFSILSSMLYIFLCFRGGDFLKNLNNSSLKSTLLFVLTTIFLIIGGIRMKNKYPKYYKYQIFSGIILLSTSLIFDIIPKLILL
ncbi:MAG: hypothetical protein MR639_14775 [Clostridium sp.]|uniref:hypothetical protein n=1 Tax=Clostridium sp. TaxID=1506 RepID=UPI002A8D8806|nr:hypothetical protein [Clostridium sp.]MDY5098575.1 hypothetical protein [Clostridium sp.]